MSTSFAFPTSNVDAASAHLRREGYVVLTGAIDGRKADGLGRALSDVAAADRAAPFDPGEAPALPQDAAFEAFVMADKGCPVEERERVVRRMRHSRRANLDTPFPAGDFLKFPSVFWHFPMVRNGSQRIHHILAKRPEFAELADHPALLALCERDLGVDMILNDVNGDVVHPGGSAGGWHIDSPLEQFPEPLPEAVFAIQAIWALSDLSESNGASRLVPGTHLSRRQPPRGTGRLDGEVVLEAPRGSILVWYGSTWHRGGVNATERDRLVVLAPYIRSWIKPMNDEAARLPPETARGFSPRLRYMLGFSSRSLVRS